ncbi:hypothetical protein HDV00_002790 [Rhizophlyctis rosea]|nr:hypothetical protein HDV00_002790 [Rhizophlyctis rosea]
MPNSTSYLISPYGLFFDETSGLLIYMLQKGYGNAKVGPYYVFGLTFDTSAWISDGWLSYLGTQLALGAQAPTFQDGSAGMSLAVFSPAGGITVPAMLYDAGNTPVCGMCCRMQLAYTLNPFALNCAGSSLLPLPRFPPAYINLGTGTSLTWYINHNMSDFSNYNRLYYEARNNGTLIPMLPWPRNIPSETLYPQGQVSIDDQLYMLAFDNTISVNATNPAYIYRIHKVNVTGHIWTSPHLIYNVAGSTALYINPNFPSTIVLCAHDFIVPALGWKAGNLILRAVAVDAATGAVQHVVTLPNVPIGQLSLIGHPEDPSTFVVVSHTEKVPDVNMLDVVTVKTFQFELGVAQAVE